MHASFLQTSDWEGFLTAYGTPVQRQEGLLFIGSKTPVGPAWSSYRCECQLIKEVPAAFKQAAYLRFEPAQAVSLEALKSLAKTHGLALRHTLSVQPHQTLIRSLLPDEELLADMKSKHRYNIRLAERKNVTIEIHTKYEEVIFERFWRLLSKTSSRQEFSVFPKEYYRTQWQHLTGEVQIHVAVATQEGTDLATMFLLTYGNTAVYLHGGSAEQGKELMAPYLLQFEAMRFSRSLGCTSYDFWGTDAALNPEYGTWKEQAAKPSAGTTRFKLGFGGEIVEYPGTWDLILKPFWYSLYHTARTLKGRKRAFT